MSLTLPPAAEKPKDGKFYWLRIARLVEPFRQEPYIETKWRIAEDGAFSEDESSWETYYLLGNELTFYWIEDDQVVCEVGPKIEEPAS